MSIDFDNFDTIKKQLLIALKESSGIISTACEKCNISRQTYYNYMKDDDAFNEAVTDVNAYAGDMVEGSLLKKIKGGDTTAIIFYCKTKLRSRGYAERVEHAGVPDQPITFTLALGDKAVNKKDDDED